MTMLLLVFCSVFVFFSVMLFKGIDFLDYNESLNKKVDDVSEEKNALAKERDSIVVGIDADTLDQYVQIYEARSGVACSEILDNNCEGCGGYIPPQIVNEALAKSIVNCGTCSRFLHKSEI